MSTRRNFARSTEDLAGLIGDGSGKEGGDLSRESEVRFDTCVVLYGGSKVACKKHNLRLAATVFALVLKYGGVGLLILGILDSSFLFAPWGNDLLLVALTARHHSVGEMFYYAAMSTVGSVLGCLLVDLTLRPLGEMGLEKHLPARRLAGIRSKVKKNAGGALAIASLAPPPFPFTAFVMGAAALQYPRVRLLWVVGATRLVRYVALGVLALLFGRHILRWLKNPILQWCLIGLIVVCTVGSVLSVYGWIKRSRSTPTKAGAAVRKKG